MIELRSVPISDEEERKFRSWLVNVSCDTLKKIITSKMKAAAADALQKAVEGKEFPVRLELSNQSLTQAHRFRDFLAILEDVKQQENPFVLTHIN